MSTLVLHNLSLRLRQIMVKALGSETWTAAISMLETYLVVNDTIATTSSLHKLGVLSLQQFKFFSASQFHHDGLAKRRSISSRVR
jgi:hypothetical protein